MIFLSSSRSNTNQNTQVDALPVKSEAEEEIGGNLWRLSNQVVTEKVGKNALLDWNAEHDSHLV